MEIKGLETHFALMRDQVKSREDCLVIALHVALLNRDIFCVGKGNDWPESHVELSELLPSEWNKNQEVYSLCYTSKSQKKYIVKIVVVPDCLLVNVLEMNDGKVTAATIKIDDYINEEFKQFSGTYKNLSQLCKVVENDMFKTAIKAEGLEAKKTDKKSYRHPEQEIEPDFSCLGQNYPIYGRGDLDPLGGGRGGGMIFQPPRMGGRGYRPRMPGFGGGDDDEHFGLPPGAIPPGARFDEYNPARLF